MAKGTTKKRDFKPSTEVAKPEESDSVSLPDRGIDFSPTGTTQIGRPGVN
jgi:hypothetical protein